MVRGRDIVLPDTKHQGINSPQRIHWYVLSIASSHFNSNRQALQQLNNSPAAYRNVKAWGEQTNKGAQEAAAQTAAEDISDGRPAVITKSREEIRASLKKKLRRAMFKIKIANSFSHVEFRAVKGETRDYAMRDIDNLVSYSS